MKKLIMLAVVAVVAAFAPGKAQAAASGTLLNLSVSGTLEVWTNAFEYATNFLALSNKTEIAIASSATVSFNNKYIYNLVSNAVANASNISTNLTSTNLPANGYIAFNARGFDNPDDEGYGTFYVTNKSGFYFPLSGLDNTKPNGAYYSYIELDDADFDFGGNYNYASKGSIISKTLKGSYTENESSVFYVHNNPYDYDAWDDPDVVFENSMAIEIRSNIKAAWVYSNWDYGANTGTVVSQSDVSTGSGCGDAVVKANFYSAVTTGKVTLTP